MKKAFTLVELLIVVVVIVTLMTMTFRLTSIGGDQSRRNTTVARLQKLENCLSGYYAAFGTYPPVRLHGSRNYRLSVSRHGIQSLNGDDEPLNWNWFNASSRTVLDAEKEREDWKKVQAACKAQPVDCRFPFATGDGSGSGWNDYVKSVSDELASMAASSSSLTDEERAVFSAGFDDGVSQNIGRHNRGRDLSEWRQVQLFKFGLMSFLLPRYLVMMGSDQVLYRDYSQWKGNNALPSDPLTGQQYNTWQQIQDNATSDNETDIARVANIPSQAVTARWMPNLAGICRCNHSFKLFGIDIKDSSAAGIPISFDIEVYSPSQGENGEGGGGANGGSTSGQYILDGVTVVDGWENEFYYYCPAPYQSYVLWSAGPNGRTFPPWVSRKELDSSANECIGYWTEDDIVNLSH